MGKLRRAATLIASAAALTGAITVALPGSALAVEQRSCRVVQSTCTTGPVTTTGSLDLHAQVPVAPGNSYFVSLRNQGTGSDLFRARSTSGNHTWWTIVPAGTYNATITCDFACPGAVLTLSN